MTAEQLLSVARMLDETAVPMEHRVGVIMDDEHGQYCLVCTCGLRSYDMTQGPH